MHLPSQPVTMVAVWKPSKITTFSIYWNTSPLSRIGVGWKQIFCCCCHDSCVDVRSICVMYTPNIPYTKNKPPPVSICIDYTIGHGQNPCHVSLWVGGRDQCWLIRMSCVTTTCNMTTLDRTTNTCAVHEGIFFFSFFLFFRLNSFEFSF